MDDSDTHTLTSGVFPWWCNPQRTDDPEQRVWCEETMTPGKVWARVSLDSCWWPIDAHTKKNRRPLSEATHQPTRRAHHQHFTSRRMSHSYHLNTHIHRWRVSRFYGFLVWMPLHTHTHTWTDSTRWSVCVSECVSVCMTCATSVTSLLSFKKGFQLKIFTLHTVK